MEQYSVIKSSSWYDPEGLNIPSKNKVLFAGDGKSCIDFLFKTREKLENEYADRKDIIVGKIEEQKILDHLEEIAPGIYRQFWKEGPGNLYFKVYYASAISKVYYTVIKNKDSEVQ